MLQNIEFRTLACFFDKESLRFSEICRQTGMPTDLGGYYVRQLVNGGFLTRSSRGVYILTPRGKQQLTRSYGLSSSINRPRLCVLIVARQNDSYVVLERGRQPFIGAMEWPAGQIEIGESMAEAAARILYNRFGITDSPQFYGYFRRIDTYQSAVFDDKLFAVHTYEIPSGKRVTKSGSTGKNQLYTSDELLKLTKPSRSLLDILPFVMSGKGGFEERIYELQPDDLSLT